MRLPFDELQPCPICQLTCRGLATIDVTRRRHLFRAPFTVTLESLVFLASFCQKEGLIGL
jgi:hypothetical protein